MVCCVYGRSFSWIDLKVVMLEWFNRFIISCITGELGTKVTPINDGCTDLNAGSDQLLNFPVVSKLWWAQIINRIMNEMLITAYTWTLDGALQCHKLCSKRLNCPKNPMNGILFFGPRFDQRNCYVQWIGLRFKHFTDYVIIGCMPIYVAFLIARSNSLSRMQP
jgi:hypothetical protein